MRARDNPFRVERLHRLRFRLQGIGWGELLDRLRTLGYTAAIVGRRGSGKTALLEELAGRLAAEGLRPRMLRIGRDGDRGAEWPSRRPDPDRDRILLVDGADTLGPLARRALVRRGRAAAGLVATAHRPGLLPTLVECRTSPRLLGELIDELLSGEGSPSRAEIEALWISHGGNLRHALRELYDLWAAR